MELGSVSKNLFSATYVEATFQISWRSVHKSGHNLDGRRRTDTRDRRPETPNDFYRAMLAQSAVMRQ